MMDFMDPVEIAAGLPFRDDKILLGWRSARRKSFPNCWDLNGGHVEVGETVEKALVREFQEEIGITPSDFRPIGKLIVPGGGPTRLSISVYQITGWTGGKPIISIDEHERLSWFSASEATGLPDRAAQGVPAVLPGL
jgi:8-oxo-dGTP diphosphatase